MKSQIKGIINKTEERYPYLGLYEDRSFIVLFTETGLGTVIYSHYNGYALGHKSHTWNENSFTRFEGTLELSN